MNSKDFHDQALIAAMASLIQIHPTAMPASVADMALAFADELLEVRDAAQNEEEASITGYPAIL